MKLWRQIWFVLIPHFIVLHILCGKTGKEIHGELANVYGSSESSYAQVKFWVGEFKRGRTSLKGKAMSGRPLDATDEEIVIAMDCCNRCWSDCEAYLVAGHKLSGVYYVYPQGMRTGYDVYCDMTTDGGGWLVFQRRNVGSEDFYQDWKTYERGFGNVSHEHWLGLYPLQRISSQARYEVRIDMEDWNGESAFATYNAFEIGSAADNFRLTVGIYYGNANDSLSRNNGQPFSTKDKDNDVHNDSCADLFSAGWWFEACSSVNLNGVYKQVQANDGAYNSVSWYGWKNEWYPLKTVEMKIRRA